MFFDMVGLGFCLRRRARTRLSVEFLFVLYLFLRKDKVRTAILPPNLLHERKTGPHFSESNDD